MSTIGDICYSEKIDFSYRRNDKTMYFMPIVIYRRQWATSQTIISPLIKTAVIFPILSGNIAA